MCIRDRLPVAQKAAIESVKFQPGLKLFMKFSQKFYPDVLDFEIPTGEKGYYDAAYLKEAEDHVLALLSVGPSTEAYYQLGSSQAIVEAVLQELDGIYNGAASQSYTGDYILKDWGQQVNTLGSWTSPEESCPEDLKTSLEDKVYFCWSNLRRTF